MGCRNKSGNDKERRMITPADSQPIIVADAGPLIRLAAAGLLESLRGLNRRIVLVDRIEDEVTGDRSKPFASEIAAWIERMDDAILRAETAIGYGIRALREGERNADQERLLRLALRDSGGLALPEFLGYWRPTEPGAAIVIYEDRRVASLFVEVDFHVTIMTTRMFVEKIAAWGINVDAVEALEAISHRYDLKPALIAEIDPATPRDMRELPQPFTWDEAPS
jgi:hypothetical protein